MDGKYTISEGFVILDENSNVVDWFDTEQKALEYVEELEGNNE